MVVMGRWSVRWVWCKASRKRARRAPRQAAHVPCEWSAGGAYRSFSERDKWRELCESVWMTAAWKLDATWREGPGRE